MLFLMFLLLQYLLYISSLQSYITSANMITEYVVYNVFVASIFSLYFSSTIGFKNVDKCHFKVHGSDAFI
jgi:hypothetical protein